MGEEETSWQVRRTNVARPLFFQYHGSYSLRHWLQLSDWLPTLEATLALDEEWARRPGDDTVGGPAVTRQLRVTRILMRELLIGVSITVSLAIASAMRYVNDNGVDLIFTFYSLLMAPQVNYLHSHGLPILS